jgi:pimeloyl-ACP methyl ester carboxylesterase
MAERLPIVYVRGFAGGTSTIDQEVEDPFYGFNAGSTHVRIGGRGDPLFHQFESPLLRLMLDHGYQLFVHGGQQAWLAEQDEGEVEPASLWIHRFYDVSASTFGQAPRSFRLERAAEDLLELIQLIRAKTEAPRVHLVAHSMGGLICRSLLQKVIPDRDVGAATDLVDRLFTYATPHGGIEFDVGFGLLERLRDTLGPVGADIFGPKRMYEYLTPGEPGRRPRGWRANQMPDEAFPKDRMFSLIGTNPGDYDAGRGVVSKVVGAKSDGLVQIENAYVEGAKFAYVHRSHSGRYGIVNSEEGYQNLRRFLFGDLEVQADLVHLELPPRRGKDEVVWQAEVELAVRGLPVVMHQQLAAHHCPVVLEEPRTASDRPYPLVTTFLIADPRSRPEDASTARYTLRIRVLSLKERGGIFDFRDHLEQSPDFEDVLVVDVGVEEDRLAAWVTWNSELPSALRDHEPSGPPLEDEEAAENRWVSTVPLPATARTFLGANAAVRLTVQDRGRHGRSQLDEPGRAADVLPPPT